MDHFYDRYDLRARLSVAILIIAPIVLDVSFCIKYQEGSIAAVVLALIAIAFSCCGIAAVQYFSNTSKKSQNRKNLAATMLLPNDNNVSDATKQRYFSKLKRVNPELSPLIDDIAKDPNSYEKSRSIIYWILENTRDNNMFPVLAEDKIGYGFAKNMYTVKPFAIAVFCIESVTAIGIMLWQTEAPCLIDKLCKVWDLYSLEIILSTAIHLVILFVWILIARKKFYISAERRLALSILHSIDGIKE